MITFASKQFSSLILKIISDDNQNKLNSCCGGHEGYANVNAAVRKFH